MTGTDDSPFTRWSRRKLAARKAEVAEADQATDLPEAVGKEDIEGGDLQPEQPDAAEPSEPLPRLEDLTAESDVSAFLRKGVPRALQNTALRKMWSLDPVIRDYVGPAEYAWDFNKPGSMAGFGPLEAGKSVANFLSTVSRFEPQGTQVKPQSAPPEGVVSSTEEPATLPQEAAASPNAPVEISAPAEPAQPADPPQALQPERSQNETTFEATAADRPEPGETPRISARLRHGGALPR